MRRLGWPLVVVGERRAALRLRWSWWRGWQQAGARWYHHRRPARTLSEPPPQAQGADEPRAQPPAAPPAAPPQAEIAVGGQRLEPLLPAEQRTGRPDAHGRRLLVAAMGHVMRTDCGWRHRPAQCPPGPTVSSQCTQWRKTGIWATIWNGLKQPQPLVNEELQL
ncbi:MAG: transposase [Chloroflexales bacterium]|nr:transposase [Chloroflexales bacterium]